MLQIGRHCDECGLNDFLPFECAKCGKDLCTAHREAHACKDKDRANVGTATQPKSALTAQPKSTTSTRTSTTSTTSTTTRTTSTSTRATQPPKRTTPPKPTNRDSQTSKASRLATLFKLMPFPKKEPPKKKIEHRGDEKVPKERRVNVVVKRPAQAYTDAVSGEVRTLLEKKVHVFYDGSLRVGQVKDRLRVELGSVRGELYLEGKLLEGGALFSTVTEGSNLEMR